MILSKKLVSKNRKDIQVMRDLGKTYEECQKQLCEQMKQKTLHKEQIRTEPPQGVKLAFNENIANDSLQNCKNRQKALTSEFRWLHRYIYRFKQRVSIVYFS